MKDVKLPFCTIEELRDKAYAIVGEPDPVQFGDRVVGIIESRDGTVLDVCLLYTSCESWNRIKDSAKNHKKLSENRQIILLCSYTLGFICAII